MPRQAQKTIYLFCEGETEEKYIECFKSYVITRERLRSGGYAFADIVKASSPKELYRLASKKINENKSLLSESFFWLIFDKDQHTGLKKIFENVNTLKNKKRKPVNISIAFSSISFETFILMHHEFSTKEFICSKELIDYLNKRHGETFAKNSADACHAIIKKYEQAITNSVKLNSHTESSSTSPMYERGVWTDFHRFLQFLEKIYHIK